ncbi:succinate dehydrogenase [Celeribacter sp. HF31]|uniref:succinate dehydrogenase n=1 Tax=Celeribacter sp. HF31 TaxID=2721558 RepID=UPI0014306CDA|nr:succinate dehydrogenase [Celeribacter sp. HF31]NIY80506.1 succinate dehydrogenase [Celeribacter sp. HF31]
MIRLGFKTPFAGGIAGMMLLALSGCIESSALVEDTTRSAAKSVVKTVINDKFPGVNADVYVDCIMDNAEMDQLVSLAQAAVVGVDQSTVQIVTDIAREPETLRCIAQGALGVPSG